MITLLLFATSGSGVAGVPEQKNVETPFVFPMPREEMWGGIYIRTFVFNDDNLY